MAHETRDNYKGYKYIHDLDEEAKVRVQQGEPPGNGGRHVMEIDKQLVDGYHGYTCAQYINAAYQVPEEVRQKGLGRYNNAEMRDGGTIAVMKGKIIWEGEEILMALP